jgi:3-hydroxybutyryl-CoA dehydratase
MVSKYWEDFKVDEEVITPSITITDAHLVNWAGLTMDFYPLHMDEEYAKKTIFKGRIAHGPLTFAMAIGLVYMTGIWGDSILAWLGVENMKIPAPVRIGDTIKVYAKVTEKLETKNPSRGVIKFFWEIKNQREETVMALDYILMLHRKPLND